MKSFARLPVDYNARHVRDDLALLRSAYSQNDAGFSSAVDSITRVLVLLAQDATIGVELEHRLSGWRRVKFPSQVGGNADLRIIYRDDRTSGRIVLRAFGHRTNPVSIYATAIRSRR